MKSSAILLSAVKWWKRKRPLGWDQAEHLLQPGVNCRGIEEHELAEAIAQALREKDEIK